jgi:hypothetical protein
MHEINKERMNEGMNKSMKECIFIDNITSWKNFHLFTVTTHIFLHSLTGAEISVMASPTGPNANNTGAGLWILIKI